MQKEPADAEDYKNRGDAYLVKGNVGQAISNYTKAIETNPKDGEAYNNRAVMYFGEREYAKAKEDIRKAQALGYEVSPQFLEKLKQCSADTSQPENSNMEIERVNIVLDGIFVDASGKYKAMINGSTVSEGSDISGIKIDKINKDSVDIIVNGQKKNMLIRQGEGNSIKTIDELQKPSIDNDNANTDVSSKEHYNNAKKLFDLGISQIKGAIDAQTDYALLYSYEIKGPKGDEKKKIALRALEDEIHSYDGAEQEAQHSLQNEQLTEAERVEMLSVISRSKRNQSETREESMHLQNK